MSSDVNGITHATDLYNARSYAKAREVLQAVLVDRPNDTEALALLSGCLAGLGDAEGGLTAIRRALDLDAQSPFVQTMFGHVLALANRLEDAEKQFKKVLISRPNDIWSVKFPWAHIDTNGALRRSSENILTNQ